MVGGRRRWMVIGLVTVLLFGGGSWLLRRGSGVAIYDGPLRVGLQIGHEAAAELPEELAWLRTATGASWNGLSEAQVNRAIAEALRDQLEATGIIVDLLPATVPPGYQADAFIALHADGSLGELRGWKIAAPRRASENSRALAAAIAMSYRQLSGLPEHVGGVTRNMVDYYAFHGYGLEHTVAETVPAVILETGFLTSAEDRTLIVERPQDVAAAIAPGVLTFLAQLDRSNTAGYRP